MIQHIENFMRAVSHAIHISKPVLLELVLFAVFLAETWHWFVSAVMGVE